MQINQTAFLTPSATTFHQTLGSSGSIKKWRKYERVEKKLKRRIRSKCSKKFRKTRTQIKKREREKNNTNTEHPQMWLNMVK